MTLGTLSTEGLRCPKRKRSHKQAIRKQAKQWQVGPHWHTTCTMYSKHDLACTMLVAEADRRWRGARAAAAKAAKGVILRSSAALERNLRIGPAASAAPPEARKIFL